jgi:hypothetical protein
MEQNSLLLRHKELKLLERLWRRSAAAFNQNRVASHFSPKLQTAEFDPRKLLSDLTSCRDLGTNLHTRYDPSE